MTLTSKDELWQKTADLPWEDVPIRKPPTGEVVAIMRIRGMSGDEVTDWQEAAVQQNGKRKRQSPAAMAMAVVTCAVNEDGTPYFEQRETLKVSQMPGYALLQLVEVALKLSGLKDEDFEELVEGFDDSPSELHDSD